VGDGARAILVRHWHICVSCRHPFCMTGSTRWCVVAIIVVSGLAQNSVAAQAQRRGAEIGVAPLLRNRARLGVTSIARKDSPRENVVGIRALSAIGGVLVGTAGGAYIGSQFRDCNCDDPGVQEAIEGFLIGGVAGAALGAALPDLNSVCPFKERIGRSLVGALAGGILGATAGRGTIATIFTAPLGGAGGALASLGRCWKSSGL
jgi:hypothetical protein